MWNSIESVGDLAVPVDVFAAVVRVADVVALLDGRPDVPAVGVRLPGGRPAILTRDRLDAVAAGVRAVRGPDAALDAPIGDVAVPVLEVPARTSVTVAIDELRASDGCRELLVAHPDGTHGLVTGPALLDHLTNRYVHQALHDPLTGLPNRVLLEERVAHLREHRDRAERTVILFVDLDGFKDVNDNHGHDVGDGLLREVAGRLLESVRDHDTVSRIGGDEFVVLLEDLDRASAADVIAERMLERIEQPTTVGDVVLEARASIGIAHIADQRDDVDQMLQRADEAMYRAKRGDGPSIVWWDDHDSAARTRARLQALRHSVAEGLVEVWFQPKLSPWDDRLREVEALARWQYRAEWVPPSEFVGLARQHGFIRELGAHVLRGACRVVAEINALAQDPITLAVNVTREELSDPTYVVEVSDALVHSGLDPQRLRLEIDDRELPATLGPIAGVLFELTEMGVRLSLDGFGAGTDSLVRLTELPISEVKLDHVLLSGARRPRAAAVARMLVATAHELGAEVTAERVETEDEAAFVSSIDCDLVQGWHTGRPMRADVFDLYARTELGVTRRTSGGSAAGRRDW